jgi:CubicO group peptidase (beta-lactamase class C family)
MKYRKKLICGAILTVLLFFLSGLPNSAQAAPQKPTQTASSPASQTGPTDPRELEAFLDRFFAERMQAEHIPGAAFVLVKDGKIFFSKGYGYADLEKQTPVVPDKTVFRVGSVSKLFTATALMQLIQQGKVKVTDDVNKYLKRFQLENKYPQPVTIANLLTHTGGIDETFIGIAAHSQSEITPLGEYIAEHTWRSLAPGKVIRYSNHGFALAGYIVETVSHTPFAQYIDENILQPLGMHHSSFLFLPQLVSDMAVGYRYKNGSYQPLPMFYTNAMPSGALNITAGDMARFAIAHLQKGRYGNVRILQQATAEEMHRRHFTHHLRLPGVAYGFSERFQNGLRALEHDGHLAGFKSRLFLLPDQNIGFFCAYNNDKGKLHDALIGQFLDHYYPALEKPALPQPPADFQKRSQYFTGRYRYIRYPHRTIDKLSMLLPGSPLLASELEVTENSDGALTLGSSRLVEVEPKLFQHISGSPVRLGGTNFPNVAFRENDQGRITHLLIGKNAFEKLSWYENRTFQLSLLVFCVVVFLSGSIVFLVEQLQRSWRKQLFYWLNAWGGKSRQLARWTRFIAGLVCTLNLVFLISFVVVLALIDISELAYGMPLTIIALLCIPLITTGLTFGLPILTLMAWRNKSLSVVGRLHYSLITLAALSFILFLDYWNLLGFRF